MVMIKIIVTIMTKQLFDNNNNDESYDQNKTVLTQVL